MFSLLLLPVVMFPGLPAAVRGQYVEARTCDVFTGSCFANADTGLTGKNAALAWKVEAGSFAGVEARRPGRGRGRRRLAKRSA